MELDQAPNRIYLQVKTRSTQLQWSDISSTLDNFAHIRNEHSSGARNGSPSFFIVCNVAPSASLQDKYAGTNWPTDVRILSPAIGEQPDFLPPVWPTIGMGLTWCREQADAIPFVSVAGDVLVWKLAAIVQCACTGEGGFDHSFLAEDLPTLFSQVKRCWPITTCALSMSQEMHCLPSRWAATAAVKPPPQGSITRSPGCVK